MQANILPGKLFTEGMPCHKFILGQLSTVIDCRTFTKSYVSTMLGAKMEHSQIEMALALLSSKAPHLSGVYRFDKWYRELSGFGLIDNIVMDNKVAAYKSCRQYYKNFDSKYTACALCPLAKNYKNAKMESERQVVRFCLESREHLNYVLSKNVNADMFISVVDVTEGKAVSVKPTLYPFYKRTFESLLYGSCADDIFDECVEYGIVLEKYHTSRVAKYSGITKNCSTTVNTFCAVMIAKYLPRQACSDAQIDHFIKDLLPDTDVALSSLFEVQDASKDGVVHGGSCNMGLDGVKNFYSSSTAADAAGTQSKNNVLDSEKESSFEYIELDAVLASMEQEYVANGLFDEDMKLDISFNIEQDVKSDSETDAGQSVDADGTGADETCVSDVLDRDRKRHEGTADECSAASLPSTYRVCEQEYARHSSCSETNTSEISVTEIPFEEEVALMEEDGLIGVPVLDEAELHHFALNLDEDNSLLLSMFESYILKDKRLSLEVVSVDGEYILLLYSPKMHAYFYSRCKTASVTEIIGEVLSYPSVIKFCYAPYVLVGILRHWGMRIRNLQSLYTISSFLYSGHRMPMGAVLRDMGAVAAEGGVTVYADGIIRSTVMKYMHCYHSLFYRYRKRLLKQGVYNEYEKRNVFDVLLGMSYFQSTCSKSHSYLFKLSGAGGYVFNDRVPTEFKIPGKSYCIYFRHAPGGALGIIVHVLCELYRCGFMDKCCFMLLSMGESFFSYYIADEESGYADIRINRMLLGYLKKLDLRGVEYLKTEISQKNI